MYQFIDTPFCDCLEQPLSNVGQASFDCYDLPDEEILFTDGLVHPVMLPGIMTAGQCLAEETNVSIGGTICSFQVFNGLSALNPLSEGYIGIGGNNGIGAALTRPVGDLDDLPEDHGEGDVEFPDLCSHLAVYAKNNLDPDACFIEVASQLIPGKDPEGQPLGANICVTMCGMEVKPGVLHIWVNESFLPGAGRKLSEMPDGSIGIVAHKISNN
jgi:hypothetical protein